MKQQPLPGMFAHPIVNAASVKHRSPFRYPGGKTWLVPRVLEWLRGKDKPPGEFIEPFAGGAIVGLSAAFEQLVQQVTLVELDPQVAAVWQAIINTDDGAWLADQILAFDLTPQKVDELLAKSPVELRERALQTIVKNRVNRGGILAQGAGRLKHGEGQRGLASRWYPETLARRIREIVAVRDRLHFMHSDGLDIIEANRQHEDVVYFIDPPYTASARKSGSRLYDCSDVDHERLFHLLTTLTGDFLVTYDFAEEIMEIAAKHNLDYEAVLMKNTHHATKYELLIAKDLDWLRR